MGMLLTYHEGYREHPELNSGEGAEKPLDRKNKAELQEAARALGLSDEGTKAELLARVKAGQPSEDPADGATEPDASPYAELTDEQLAEAYATNVGGDAEGREDQQAELDALDNG